MYQIIILFISSMCFLSLFGCESSKSSSPELSRIKIYPSQNVLDTVIHSQTVRILNCGIPEISTQTVSYSISFGIDYELLQQTQQGELDIGMIELDLSFAQNTVAYYLDKLPQVNFPTGIIGGIMTMSRDLPVQPNEIRVYELSWKEEWAVGMIGVPIADAREDVVNTLVNINKFLDNISGDRVNGEEGRQGWESELKRLREREYLIPFRMPIGLNIEAISLQREAC